MVRYLLIDNGKERRLAPYAQRYVLFSDPKAALQEAERRGLVGMFGGPPVLNFKPGVANVCAYGDVSLMILALEETA